MADSPDGTRDSEPSLRIGGWLPDQRHRGAPPPYDATADRDGRHRADTAPGPTSPPPRVRRAASPPGGPARTLVLACVAVGVVATLAFALSPFWSSPGPATDEAIDSGPSAGAADPVATEVPSISPTWAYSPAPVSLSTRAALPTRTAPAPTRRPTKPPSRTTASPRPSTTSPKPTVQQPRPDELAPLPPSQEPALRSSGGGAETFIDFVNTRSSQVVVHWLDYGGQRQPYAVLAAGQSYRQHTYVGHPWVVTDASKNALVCFLPTPEAKKAVIR